MPMSRRVPPSDWCENTECNSMFIMRLASFRGPTKSEGEMVAPRDRRARGVSDRPGGCAESRHLKSPPTAEPVLERAWRGIGWEGQEV